MENKLYRLLVIVSASVLLLHVSILPIVTSVGAIDNVEEHIAENKIEAVDSSEEMTTEKNPDDAIPVEKSNETEKAATLDETTAPSPHFVFTHSKTEGVVGETLNLSFYATIETTEASIWLPQEATVVEEELPLGITVEKVEGENRWLVHSEQPKTNFILPIMIEQAGIYEVSTENEKGIVEILEEKDMIVENNVAGELEEIDSREEIVINGRNDDANLLKNPNFQYIQGVDTTIPDWELASSTTPVNFLSRNLTISESGDTWNQLSDSNFYIGLPYNSENININRRTGARTLIINQ